jgi:hypothetical protein
MASGSSSNPATCTNLTWYLCRKVARKPFPFARLPLEIRRRIYAIWLAKVFPGRHLHLHKNAVGNDMPFFIGQPVPVDYLGDGAKMKRTRKRLGMRMKRKPKGNPSNPPVVVAIDRVMNPHPRCNPRWHVTDPDYYLFEDPAGPYGPPDPDNDYDYDGDWT